MIQERHVAPSSVPVPPVGYGTLFLNSEDGGKLYVKTSDGEVAEMTGGGGATVPKYLSIGVSWLHVPSLLIDGGAGTGEPIKLEAPSLATPFVWSDTGISRSNTKKVNPADKFVFVIDPLAFGFDLEADSFELMLKDDDNLFETGGENPSFDTWTAVTPNKKITVPLTVKDTASGTGTLDVAYRSGDYIVHELVQVEVQDTGSVIGSGCKATEPITMSLIFSGAPSTADLEIVFPASSGDAGWTFSVQLQPSSGGSITQTFDTMAASEGIVSLPVAELDGADNYNLYFRMKDNASGCVYCFTSLSVPLALGGADLNGDVALGYACAPLTVSS